ncbi:NAD(P)-binding protein [Neorhodopirellula pilleata]|uniref:Deoxyribodipyrimidine photo-lyase n=1 Tax=Neorhodopirellula pilleata TaxID=2714738 RepID=A0A5C5ZKM9_9BACT|nr:NAD(P)-binding protein [Neorhodopirellula pilleata]TWT86983.1 Deoxyribodipyrimidine photo-lyase [Neorhodopirellula pilleata]
MTRIDSEEFLFATAPLGPILDYQLPTRLSERCEWLIHPDQTACDPGEFVLYWMHNAIRGHENPALDVAVSLAHQNGLPLLVYHGLSEKYPFASDRHHAFILQAARDVQRDLTERGISYAFHLERAGHRGPHLRDLARRAAVLVTEAMPVAPLVAWTERIKCLVTTPFVSVDTTCLLSLAQVTAIAKPNDLSPPKPQPEWFCQPSRYRQITAGEYKVRCRWEYETMIGGLPTEEFQEVATLRLDESELGFEPVDLQNVCLSELIGQCKIDHTIAPIADSPGGMRAGYLRWEHFRDHSLAQYGQHREDESDFESGSRLSAYLHYGMVSPFRIAREASASQDASPHWESSVDRFLDELLTWREMSFHFCQMFCEDLDTFDVIPDWAKATLRQHAMDPRDGSCDWESLARARTGLPLWDAAQRSLLKQGELHNNVRLTWGKAFLSMTTCPEQALNHCIDLNHRFALDGRSPASYGGILWCFGQFDEPLEDAHPIYGRIRPRSVQSHADRIDFARFARHVDRPIAKKLPRVAVVGAGIGGLMAARVMHDHGLRVTVFDKSRGVGGRLATRRHAAAPSFDHGAQYFTVRDDRFARYVRSWMAAGVAEAWMNPIVELDHGRIVDHKRSTPRYVGKPAMNSIAKHLAEDLSVTTGCTVGSLRHDNATDAWQLKSIDADDLGTFDVVIVNCPPQQASALLNPHTDLVEHIEQVEMSPCWSLMISCDGAGDLPFAGAFINDGPLSWIARNDAKPGRPSHRDPNRSDWVLHASIDWTTEHLDANQTDVCEALTLAFSNAIDRKLGTIHHRVAHRWLYANTNQPLPQSCLWDRTTMLGACGDWCGGPRVEGAFLSGAAIAGCVLRHVTVDRCPALARS